MEKTFNAKTLNVKIKNGYTIKDFANYYSVLSSEFVTMVEETFTPKAAKGMLSRMQSNEKKHRNKRNAGVNADVVIEDSAIPELTESVEDTGESVENVESAEVTEESAEVTEESAETTQGNRQKELAELEKERQDLQSSIEANELVHKRLVSENRQIMSKIVPYKQILLELQAQVKECESQICSLVENYEENSMEMSEVNARIAEDKTKISEVEKSIKAHEKISLFLYSNGEIEVDTFVEIEKPDSDNIQKVFQTIIANDLAGNLTVNQLRALAKYLCVEKWLKSQNFTYEVAFENTDMEVFYIELKK